MAKISARKHKLILLILSIIISLTAMEFVLRATGKIWVYSRIINMKGRPYIVVHSPYLPFTLPKRVRFRHQSIEYDIVYEFNHLGYRGYFPRSIKKPAHKKRILFLGDSFTLGAGIELEETFVQQVQASLDLNRYEVINAAYHAGYSPDAYYAYLAKEGMELSPDVIIVVLYSGNDVSDMQDNLWLETDGRGAPTRIMTVRMYMDITGMLIHPPEALHPFMPWNHRIPGLRDSHLFIAATQLINRMAGIPGFSDRLKGETVSMDEAWRRFEIFVEAISRWCADNDAGIFFILIPPDPGRENNAPVHDRIVDIVRNKYGQQLIDARSFLSMEAYLARDAHFNNVGHAITARTIMDYLEKTGFVK
jgi:hypothetical protein